MLQKVLKNFCLRSTVFQNKKYDAFSIAEMLVVLTIVAFLAIGLPAIHFKKTEMKTRRSLHGRFECYYNGTTLMQYAVAEGGAAVGPTAVGSCTFTPPPSAVFFLVHAVGGGGGGKAVTSGANINTMTEPSATYRKSAVSLFPEWMQQVMRAGGLPTIAGNDYTAFRSGSRAMLKYGNAGGAGQTVSMFFPALNNVNITMRPGLGGAAGAAGASTTVDFNGTNIITAPGGGGGTGSGDMTVWMDGTANMCDVKNLDVRKFKEADFSQNVELDTGSTMESKMVESLAGSGGAGGYSNATSGGTVTYNVSGTNVSAFVDRTAKCQNPTQCDDGSSSGVCPAQAGRNGAVVILW